MIEDTNARLSLENRRLRIRVEALEAELRAYKAESKIKGLVHKVLDKLGGK